MADRIKCYRQNCFQNDCGTTCKLLKEHSIEPECPFFKTHEQAEEDRAKSHQKLVAAGRWDLIEAYEYNPGRDW